MPARTASRNAMAPGSPNSLRSQVWKVIGVQMARERRGARQTGRAVQAGGSNRPSIAVQPPSTKSTAPVM